MFPSAIHEYHFVRFQQMSKASIPKLEANRAEDLLKLAKDRFSEDLKGAEARILSDSACSGFPNVEELNGPLPLIRPEFLRWIVADEEVRKFIDPRGIRIWLARVPGEVNLSDCAIPLPLDFRRCEFDGRLSLIASETRQIGLQACTFAAGLSADRLIAHGTLVMRRIESHGEIRLHGASIGGDLEISGSNIYTSGNAVTLDQATIQGNLLLKSLKDSESVTLFRSKGSIHMNGTSVKGDVVCSGVRVELALEDTQDSAFYFDRIRIGGSLDLSINVEANRGIRAVDAVVDHYVAFRGVRLTVPGAGLNLNRARVGGSAFLDLGLEVPGDINLANARVAYDLNFNGARLGRTVGEGCTVGGDAIWTNVGDAPSSKRSLNLSSATVRAFMDDEKSWPEQRCLVLDGMTYRSIELFAPQNVNKVSSVSLPPSLPFNANKRIEWLRLQNDENQLRPQPWMQLASFAREIGHDEEARHVMYVYDCIKTDLATPRARLIYRCFAKWLAALREKPVRILKPIFCCLLVSSLLFWHAGRMRAIAPTNSAAYLAWTQDRLSDQAYPRFNGMVYAVENSLPILKLGQSDSWAPDPHYKPQNWFPNHPDLDWTAWFSSYEFLSIARIILNVLGWGFGIILGLALTTRLKL
jgi:hypothetical protein